MLTELQLHGFRGFDTFTAANLQRVNLLVGRNNSGKTSILEAISIAKSRGNPRALWNILRRRGERIWHTTERRVYTEVDVCHIFHGHTFDGNFTSEIVSVEDGERPSTISFRVIPRDTTNVVAPVEQRELFREQPEDSISPYQLRIGVREKSGDFPISDEITDDYPLSNRGGLSVEVLNAKAPPRMGSSVRFVTTGSLQSNEVISLFDEIALTPEEDMLIEALRIIEPGIERLASKANIERGPGFMGEREGMVVKCKGVNKPIPIGSMGDGIWRMLAIALAMVGARDGAVLIDEIDTGLHYSVMENMWQLVFDTAHRLNVQVFATTHSRDCYESLASVVSNRANKDLRPSVSIQRIERDQKKTVSFDSQEIAAIADNVIELR
jgi:ABC-type branched-subunit amino acid transport system ATPase component